MYSGNVLDVVINLKEVQHISDGSNTHAARGFSWAQDQRCDLLGSLQEIIVHVYDVLLHRGRQGFSSIGPEGAQFFV